MKFMIGIFVLLIISMIFVGKYCKKKSLKVNLAIAISLVTFYCVMVSIDMSRTNSFHTPIFTWNLTANVTTAEVLYQGLGYKINIKYYDNGIIEKIEMYMFGKVIAGGIQDIKNPKKLNININENNLVSISVNEESITNSKAIFVLVNHTDETYIYGEPYFIEYEKDSIWYELTPINNMDFNYIAYILKSKESREIVVDWEYHYGKLAPGKYRIIKDVFRDLDIPIEPSDKVYIGAEFIII